MSSKTAAGAMSSKTAAGAMTGLPAAAETAFAESAAFWRAIAFATAPADRANAEDGIRLAYEAAGLTPPETVIWCYSPAAAAQLAESPLPEWGAPVREAVRTKPWEAARAELHTLLGTAGWARAWALASAPLAATLTPLNRRVRDAIAATATPEARPAMRAVLTLAVHGQHDAPWLSVFDAAARNVPGFGGWARLEGIARVARNAGWWWPFENAVLISERPDALHLDELGRLHNGDGAALSYPDGFALHAWSGMRIEADFVASLQDLTPRQLHTEPNAELRRVMFEYFGYERFFKESGAQAVHEDETGKLWRIEFTDDEPIVMVEVVNSTPEPDGSHSVYWLRVPPSTRTAKAGVAWTFGLDEDSYRPAAQT